LSRCQTNILTLSGTVRFPVGIGDLSDPVRHALEEATTASAIKDLRDDQGISRWRGLLAIWEVAMVGAIPANLHEGSRSEYLAQYVFASFGTVVPVPHHEDSGIDLYGTLAKRVGKLAWPQSYFTVQVKSTDAPWIFKSKPSVRWLIQHPLPVFLCVVDKTKARIRPYHTSSRFDAWSLPPLPQSLTLTPEAYTCGPMHSVGSRYEI
jgi:hypothetical protein